MVKSVTMVVYLKGTNYILHKELITLRTVCAKGYIFCHVCLCVCVLFMCVTPKIVHLHTKAWFTI